MLRKITFFTFLNCFSSLISQNIEIADLDKFYYYRTIDDFFNNKKDSLDADKIAYDYGKVSYIDRKTNKKIKFDLHKDSSIFAFELFQFKKIRAIYAISPGEKRYGVWMGGNKNFYGVFYSRGHFHSYFDAEKYLTSYSGNIDEFGFYVVYTKKDFKSRKNGDLEYFIKDNETLYKKYIDERTEASTFNWNKHFIMKQVEYMHAYNN